MILIFYITHKVISLHGENQIGSRNDITPDWSHGWNNFDQMLMQDSKPLLLSNLRTTKMNDDVLAIAVSPDAKKRKPGGNVAEFQPDIRMLGLSPSHYVLRTLSNVKTNDMEQTFPRYHLQML
ncbi:hypothetical protein Patl1_27686 [Pistacia atlantica]|uniref:Uncharacterized protein n=1 Tax=Pistacia atlantica TaxID=434234 RepID=A0ACC1BCP8_9ROSI|nr:hypothetical protein Patl1_27686 [Pistacia atlantica]